MGQDLHHLYLENPSNPEQPEAKIPKPREADLAADHVQCALVKVIDALKPLPREARLRVVKTAATFFGDSLNGSSGIR